MDVEPTASPISRRQLLKNPPLGVRNSSAFKNTINLNPINLRPLPAITSVSFATALHTLQALDRSRGIWKMLVITKFSDVFGE
jgi:hypothetical protein